MKRDPKKEFEVNIKPDDPVFVIGVVSEMVQIPIWTLRKLDEMGLVSPQRLGKKTRCYTTRQVKKLYHIQYLMTEKGINISGVKYILEVDSVEE